jgi:hypothetical protein
MDTAGSIAQWLAATHDPTHVAAAEAHLADAAATVPGFVRGLLQLVGPSASPTTTTG